MTNAIEVNNLRKSYGNNEVLKGISFNVRKGEIFGILGVNGAGKTTTLECIEGFRRYNSGTIKINGKIGIQLQSASLPSYIKVGEAVQLLTKWKKTKLDTSVLSSLGIDNLEKKLYMELSTGQKRRLHLALALIGNPDILFLDEATAGLDVEGRISLHNEIRKLSEKGTTIILSSHDMAEVENLCSRIGILNQGKISFIGTTDELASKIGKRYNIKILTEHGEKDYFTTNIADSLLKILEEYKQKNITILDIKVDRGTLEQHFMQHGDLCYFRKKILVYLNLYLYSLSL